MAWRGCNSFNSSLKDTKKKENEEMTLWAFQFLIKGYKYCIQDCKLTAEFFQFLIKGYQELVKKSQQAIRENFQFLIKGYCIFSLLYELVVFSFNSSLKDTMEWHCLNCYEKEPFNSSLKDTWTLVFTLPEASSFQFLIKGYQTRYSVKPYPFELSIPH